MTKKEIKKLDKIWADAVKVYGKCMICDSVFSLNAHHIFSRRHYNVRWELSNGFCVCRACHLWTIHKDTYIGALCIKNSVKEKELERLHNECLVTGKQYDYNDLLKKLNKQIKKRDKEKKCMK